jgi:HAMP domain-containing protein
MVNIGEGYMKTTIWLKILLFAVIPLMLLYVLRSVFITRLVFQDKVNQIETELKNLARFNGMSFQEHINAATLTVLTTAAELEDIDPARPDARALGERILVSGLKNRAAVNVWMIFEPDAFDGRDAEHGGEYPGESSGRYRRSYVRQGAGYVEAPDKREALPDTRADSSWYLVPKTREVLLLNAGAEYEGYRDYGVGTGPVNRISLAAPLFRKGKFIGCVGQDIQVTDDTLGPDMAPGAVSALFASNGILRYHRDRDMVGKSPEELGFTGTGAIREALGRGEDLLLSGEYSPLLGAKARSYFWPVRLADFDEPVYVYAALPETRIREALFPFFRSFLYFFLLSLVLFAFSLYYLSRRVSKPLHDLSLACDAISRGNFDADITHSHFKDEVGILARSLYRMVEQCRVHITLRERSQKLLDMYTRLYTVLYRHGRMDEVFDELLPIVGDYFKVSKASLVLVNGEAAQCRAFYEPGRGPRKAAGEEFAHHRQVTQALSGKKYVSLNAGTLREQKLDFFGQGVLFLCILPFFAARELRGYIIMEGGGETGPLIHNDAIPLFLSETLSFMLDLPAPPAPSPLTPAPSPLVSDPPPPLPRVEAPAVLTVTPVAPEPASPVNGEGSPVIGAARSIPGLDVDTGLFHTGGGEAQYADLLRISARSFAGKLPAMRTLYRADLPAFAIEIHGMKGALYSIGASALGDQARELEYAAKAGDAEGCARRYPVFEEHLGAFTAGLAAITGGRKIPPRGPGSVPVLIATLREALEASRCFDSAKAGDLIASLLGYSWEPGDEAEESSESPPRTAQVLEHIADALESMEYDGAERDMGLLLDYFKAAAPEHGMV